jgi:uncharacterized protein with HEPN domain
VPSDSVSPEDPAALVDIAVHARRIVATVGPSSQRSFLADLVLQDATQYRLVAMGEAVKRLSLAFREGHEEVAWAEVAGLRDVIVHRYHRVSLERIWAIAHDDIPVLLAYIEPLLPPES